MHPCRLHARHPLLAVLVRHPLRPLSQPTLQAALTPPSSDSAPLYPRKIFVDLFAGASAPLSAAMSALGLARLEPLDKLHGCHFDLLLDDRQYRELCALASSGAVGAASAAPPCAPFSRARLRPGGPAPVRTPEHPTGIPSPSQAQQRELSESAELHSRARHFLALVAAHGGLIILENPASSLLWLDPSVRAWLSVHAPFCTHIAACQFGLALPKAWAFWSNFDLLSGLGCRCPHPPRFHPSFAGKRNSDGSFATRQTACYPQPLAEAIAACIQHFMSMRAEPFTFASWRELLPPSFLWPIRSVRVEDGAGTCSSAFWGVPRERDLVSPSKDRPLSDRALSLFEQDVRTFLQIESNAVWAKLLAVDEGQPFRLNLWHCLSVLCHDPDMDFFRLLHDGVPLGIGAPIPPCKVLFPPEPSGETVIPLQPCDSAWKSALDHAELVDELLETELRWIRPVPGGDAKLRRRYSYTAVGKLGVVVAADRPPRLVVDSSVSGVTSNTHLPNKAPNPSLSDVRKCLPLCPANESLAGLVLDVSKAHRRVRIRPQDQGLLCFRHRDESVTLNFGARASGFYWNRVAGLLVRLAHRLWRVRHSALIYVDDLLAILLRSSAPLLAALLVVLLCVLRVPMSWHKAALSARVT